MYPKAGVTFEDLSIGKGMSNREILGLMLRDDLFLNVITDNPKQEIFNICQSMVGPVKRESRRGISNKTSLKKSKTTIGSPVNSSREQTHFKNFIERLSQPKQ